MFSGLSPEDATVLMMNIRPVTGTGSLSGYETRFTNAERNQLISQHDAPLYLDSCKVFFRYYMIYSKGDNAFPGDFVVVLSCEGDAQAEYYPMRV